MENRAEKFLSNIAEQIKPHIENTVHGPFFMINLNIWSCVIDTNIPTIGSLRFNLFQPENEEESDLSFEFYSEENRTLLLKIFKKVKNLLNTTNPGIYQTEGSITLDWNLNLNDDEEIFLFLCKTFIFFQKFFIAIKDLQLIKLKKSNGLFDRKNFTYAYTRKKKTPKTITKVRLNLIRKNRPAILSTTKSYYYL